jgi:N-acetylmuramic acid 6-phosphate etherase
MDHLQTEARNPASHRLDELTPAELVALMNREDAKVAAAVGTQAAAVARAIEVVAGRLAKGGRLVYVGAGTSGRLGVLDAAECPPTFQSPPGQVVGLIAGGQGAMFQAVEGAEDNPDLAVQDLTTLDLSANDVLVGIATSGRTPYVIGALRHARAVGAFAVGLACNPGSELEPDADLMIVPVVGPEVLSGSTRLKAGTATKLVLNMISTGAMVRLGKAFGNLMVDLKATNTKLRARAKRIVRTLTGLDAAAAEELLTRCGWEVKTAAVAHLCGVTADEARARLAAAGGRVGVAAGHRIRTDPTRHPRLVVGIDGGGTNTVAVVADPAIGRVLGRGTGGPSNLQAVGAEAALRELGAALDGAFAAAGLPRGRSAAACIGLAGADREDEFDVLREWADRVGLAGTVSVTNDAALLIAAGTPGGWGLGVIAGTGSIAYCRTPDGVCSRAGGWGYLLGDEGSGFRIVLAAMRACCKAVDRCGPPTALVNDFLKQMGLSEPRDLIQSVYRGTWDRAALAGLAPVVLGAADAGDAVAVEVIDRQAGELARTAAVAVTTAGLPNTGLPLALTGGVFLGHEGYRTRFLDALRKLGVSPDPVRLVTEPAVGAVVLARQLVPK